MQDFSRQALLRRDYNPTTYIQGGIFRDQLMRREDHLSSTLVSHEFWSRFSECQTRKFFARVWIACNISSIYFRCVWERPLYIYIYVYILWVRGGVHFVQNSFCYSYKQISWHHSRGTKCFSFAHFFHRLRFAARLKPISILGSTISINVFLFSQKYFKLLKNIFWYFKNKNNFSDLLIIKCLLYICWIIKLLVYIKFLLYKFYFIFYLIFT